MSLVCAAGALNAGGAVFPGNADPAAPTVNGGKVVLVGDTTTCPGHSPSPISTTVLSNGGNLSVNGVEIATVGSPCSCGHAMTTGGTNTTLTSTA